MPATINIVDRLNSARSGARFRGRRPGPERQLVDWFLAEPLFIVPRHCRATLFLEPRLESGFPDLVLVFWHPATMAKWSAARADLTQADLRVLQYLCERGPAKQGELENIFRASVAKRSIERLQNAALLKRVHSQWQVRSLARSYGVRQIVAIEAKVADWRAAAQQAFLNTWFTSDSYVLLPEAGRGHPLLAAAKSLGIGVLSQADGLVRKPRSRSALPRSYASWLFNEWAWRASRSEIS